jgi:hypothetical protein
MCGFVFICTSIISLPNFNKNTKLGELIKVTSINWNACEGKYT